MSDKYYTDERNAQIILALLKAYGIRKVVASPGSTNLAFVGSVQNDSFFEVYSAVDERHAAYLALGMAAESEEPVVISCTGSTASRNYMPALTEAYYRKLPILAITSSQVQSHADNLHHQFVDRSVHPVDCVKYSVACPLVYTKEQENACNLSVCKAILELTRHGGGPVHINLETHYSTDFSVRELPAVRKIDRIMIGDCFPSIKRDEKIAVFIANHKRFTIEEKASLEKFLQSHNAVVFCDVTSSYDGARRVSPSLICSQNRMSRDPFRPSLVIHIGEMSNDHAALTYLTNLAPVWRVNSDGEAHDPFNCLEKIFEMPECFFFEHYAKGEGADDSFYRLWADTDALLRTRIPEFPFSNSWIAKQTLPKIPGNAVLHLGVSSTLQVWNALMSCHSGQVFSNVGTCGIDGCVSTMLGASIVSPQKLFFGVFGDLTFFYDLNALGNRSLGKNVRIMLINNGCGCMFHYPGYVCSVFGEETDKYLAAGGHFGRQSPDLMRHFSVDLGFEYLSASNKDEFLKVLPRFLSSDSDRPVFLECFTSTKDDCDAWVMRSNLASEDMWCGPSVTDKIVAGAKKVVPVRIKNAIRELVR